MGPFKATVQVLSSPWADSTVMPSYKSITLY